MVNMQKTVDMAQDMTERSPWAGFVRDQIMKPAARDDPTRHGPKLGPRHTCDRVLEVF